jgi:hypothetical protein
VVEIPAEIETDLSAAVCLSTTQAWSHCQVCQRPCNMESALFHPLLQSVADEFAAVCEQQCNRPDVARLFREALFNSPPCQEEPLPAAPRHT